MVSLHSVAVLVRVNSRHGRARISAQRAARLLAGAGAQRRVAPTHHTSDCASHWCSLTQLRRSGDSSYDMRKMDFPNKLGQWLGLFMLIYSLIKIMLIFILLHFYIIKAFVVFFYSYFLFYFKDVSFDQRSHTQIYIGNYNEKLKQMYKFYENYLFMFAVKLRYNK